MKDPLMKNCALSLPVYLLLLCLTNSFSQISLRSNTEKKIINQFNIFVGPSLSSLRGHASVSNSAYLRKRPKLGYGYGLGFTHLLDTRWSIDALIFYERKGVLTEQKGTYWNPNSQTELEGVGKNDYKYDAYTFAGVFSRKIFDKPSIVAGVGPYASYLQRCLHVLRVYPAGSQQPIAGSTSDETDYNRKLDVGATFQVATNFQLGNAIALTVKMIDTFGVANIRKLKAISPTRTNSTILFIGITLNNF